MEWNFMLLLLPLPQIQSIKKPKKQQIQDHHHLFISSYNTVNSSIYSIKKHHHGLKTGRNNIGSTLSSTEDSNSKNRIMIVDDEKDIARLFAITLQDNGFIVDVFIDPLSALSNYKARYYDLLLLDIKMPNMSGFELYQKIKDKDDRAKVCFITAYEESLNEFKRLFPSLEEVDCFVRKPIDIHNLVKIVKSKVEYN
ncbi:MAG: response regulator [Nitrososphaeraceae archaeon]